MGLHASHTARPTGELDDLASSIPVRDELISAACPHAIARQQATPALPIDPRRSHALTPQIQILQVCRKDTLCEPHQLIAGLGYAALSTSTNLVRSPCTISGLLSNACAINSMFGGSVSASKPLANSLSGGSPASAWRPGPCSSDAPPTPPPQSPKDSCTRFGFPGRLHGTSTGGGCAAGAVALSASGGSVASIPMSPF